MKRGFSLVTALILLLTLSILGGTAVYISQTGFKVISAEANYEHADKNAEAGLMKAIEQIVNGQNCLNLNNTTINGALIKTAYSGGSCFIWSEGQYNNSRVVKVAIITQNLTTSQYGTLLIENLNNISIMGHGLIVSCQEDCQTPALVIGNSLNNPIPENIVTECPESHWMRGAAALIDPVVENADLSNLPEVVFSNISNRNDLLNTLSSNYGVLFDNNGTPVGLTGTYANITDQNGNFLSDAYGGVFDVCRASFNNCTASKINDEDNVIDCQNLRFEWTGSEFRVIALSTINIDGQTIQPGEELARCNAIDLGQNSTLTINKFEGEDGGTLPRIAAQRVVFAQNGEVENAILVAREEIQAQQNHIEAENAYFFGKNITISGNDIEFENSLIYSGGQGQGNLNIDLRGEGEFGEDDEPVVIISDNNANIRLRGRAEINGLIYATEANNNLNIDLRGRPSINGLVVSLSDRNTNISLRGRSRIFFDPEVIEALNEQFGFINPPQCATAQNATIKPSLINTKIKVY